jgi:TonB family protein
MRDLAGVVACAATLAAGAPGLAQDRPADWLKQPSMQELMAVFPAGAIEHGLSGRAVIRCIVTLQGTLRACQVVSETPPGEGFGAAAITLTPQLLMRPALKGGVPVEGTVQIPFNFPSPAATTGSHLPGGSPLEGIPTRIYSNLPWSQAPSVADLVAAFPKRARAEKVSGRSTLDCVITRTGGLSSCETLNEEPRGYGFSGAARSLMDKFHGPTADGQGKPLQGAHTQVLITFPADYVTTSSPVAGKPRWVALPTVEDFNAAFPAAAGKAGVLKARVVLDCSVAPGGLLTDCKITSEDPPGYGFGAGAAALSGKFRTSIWTAEGLPIIGGQLSIPIRYDLQDASPPAASAPSKP